MKAERISCHQTCTRRNAKRNSSVWREMIPSGNSDLHKELKNAENGK